MSEVPAVVFTDDQISYAEERFGRPITELSRRDQRLIQRIVTGEVKELDQRVKSLMKNNLLDAAVAKVRAMEAANQLLEISLKLGKDVMQLQQGGPEKNIVNGEERPFDSLDIESVTETSGGEDGFTQTCYKSPAGKLKREIMFTEKLAKIQNMHAELVDKLATMPGEKGTVFIGKQENTQINGGKSAVKDFADYVDVEVVADTE